MAEIEKKPWLGGDPERIATWKKNVSESAKKRWAKPGERERMLELRKLSGCNEKIKAAQKKRFENPDERKRLSNIMKNSSAHKLAVGSVEHKKRLSESVKKTLANPEIRKKISTGVKKAWGDHNSTFWSESYRRNRSAGQSARMKKAWGDPESVYRKSFKLQSPDIVDKRNNAIREAWKNPQLKEKMSARMKEVWRKKKEQ